MIREGFGDVFPVLPESFLDEVQADKRLKGPPSQEAPSVYQVSLCEARLPDLSAGRTGLEPAQCACFVANFAGFGR